jgi:hypothetical protein
MITVFKFGVIVGFRKLEIILKVVLLEHSIVNLKLSLYQ